VVNPVVSLNAASTSVTSGAGAFGSWVQITASGPSALFSISSVSVLGTLAARTGAFQVGYGPAGAERVVFEGPLHSNATAACALTYTPPVLSAPIPAGSRIALRAYLGSGTAYTYIVQATRLDVGISPDTLIAHPDSFYVPAKGTAGNFGNAAWNDVVAADSMVYPLQLIGFTQVSGLAATWQWGIGTTTANDVVFGSTPPTQSADTILNLPQSGLPRYFPAGKGVVGKATAGGSQTGVMVGLRTDLPVYRLANVSPSIYEY
jgi:hypothetical protein